VNESTTANHVAMVKLTVEYIGTNFAKPWVALSEAEAHDMAGEVTNLLWRHYPDATGDEVIAAVEEGFRLTNEFLDTRSRAEKLRARFEGRTQ
jgi:hypothetical protein